MFIDGKAEACCVEVPNRKIGNDETDDKMKSNRTGSAQLIYDIRIDGAPDLLAGLQEEIVTTPIGPTLDPIGAISDALMRAETPPSTLYVVAHGAPGRVMLGADGIGVADLVSSSEAVRSWGPLMATGAQISLFCGHLCLRDDWLIETLADLTGCGVRGASGAVGPEAYGGDWHLDRQAGQAEPRSPWIAGAPEGFRGIL